MFHTSHWLKGLVRVISPHPIHACARGCLSVFFLLSFYLLSKSFFHLFLIPAMVPDENSMKDPLCNSAIGSMVTFDYVTPDTFADAIILLVEFDDLVLLELLGVRDEKFFSQHSAMIISLCSLNKVLICALELLSPTSFPVLSTIFSAWVIAEN